jgi:hypothetical protein
MNLNWLFADCPDCGSHGDLGMVAVEDMGIVDTREGDSFGAIYYCRDCTKVWNITTGIRAGCELIDDDAEREQYLAMLVENQENQ